MRNNDWLFIYSSAPEELGLTQDGLDLMLVCASFGVNVSVLFVGTGVQHILKETQLPKYVKTFGALQDFDIGQVEVFAVNQLVKCEKTDYRLPVKMIDANVMRQRINAAHQVFHF